MDQSENPFASPQSDLSKDPFDGTDPSDAESIRHQYLKHEASVKSIGLLYYFSAFVSIVAGIGLLVATFVDPSFSADLWGVLLIGFTLLIGILSVFIGNWLRALNPKAKISVGIFSVIGLFSVPFGTIINGYILYLIFSKKGKMVLSESYHEIIRQTPHIKYRTSKIVIVFAVILGVVICLGLLAFLINDYWSPA